MAACVACSVCLLVLVGILVAPFLWLSPLEASWNWHGPHHTTPRSRAFMASSVTVKETVLNERTGAAAQGCVFLARDFRSSPQGWALTLQQAPTPGGDVSLTSLVWTGPTHHDHDGPTNGGRPPSLCQASPQRDCQEGALWVPRLMAERLHNATAALRSLRTRPPVMQQPPLPGNVRADRRQSELLLLLDGDNGGGGTWELQVLVSVTPPLPLRLRVRDGALQWELFFVPELVRDLPLDGGDEEGPFLDPLLQPSQVVAVEEGEGEGLGGALPGRLPCGAASSLKKPQALCRWATMSGQPDVGQEEPEEDEDEAQGSSRRRRQTEVVVVNRRKKHGGGGNGAAVAIGLGVGLGVGIPVVVLLALVPLAIVLWFLHRRRRRNRTIRVADVPTGPGVFATGAPRTDAAYAPRPPSPLEGEDYSQADLQSALGDNY